MLTLVIFKAEKKINKITKNCILTELHLKLQKPKLVTLIIWHLMRT